MYLLGMSCYNKLVSIHFNSLIYCIDSRELKVNCGSSLLSSLLVSFSQNTDIRETVGSTAGKWLKIWICSCYRYVLITFVIGC